EERLTGVFGLFHLVQRQVDRVQKRGPALGLGEGQVVLDFLQVTGERLDQGSGIVELYQEELVLGIGELEELRHGLAGLIELAAHASAAIEDHAYRKRRVFARELGDLLR